MSSCFCYFPTHFVHGCRLVSSLSYGTRALHVLNLPGFENKKYTAYDRSMTVSMEMIRMAKFRPRNNQSQRSDFPEDYFAL